MKIDAILENFGNRRHLGNKSPKTIAQYLAPLTQLICKINEVEVEVLSLGMP